MFKWLGDLVDVFFGLVDEEPEFNGFSRYFTLEELCKSETATRKGIENIPNEEQVDNLQNLATNVLDPVREQFGAFTPSSGFRSAELNSIIGGAKNSQHMKGQAVDFSIPGVSNLTLYKWIKENLEYDQLILEHHQKDIPSSGWVHVSFSKQNRFQAFSIQK